MVVFVYSTYRDSIEEFVGKFESLEEAEKKIAEIIIENKMRWYGTLVDRDELKEEIDNMKRKAIIASKTPKPSVQNSLLFPKKFEGYSLRYMESEGNYAYAVFDPNYKPN